ncbi:MAG: redoxin domain-containing protein [Bacteroidales bacterium]|nr:redoxin domain-containing protein [Bacteroidales bacterium]
MKKILSILAAAFVAFTALAQQADTSRYAALGAKLDEYFLALRGESAQVQNEEVDFIISSCTDPDVKQWVALYVYDHYLNSKIMGEEAVAVHTAKEWFLSGKIPMASEIDLMNAKIFVQFNESSLVGMKAPSLTLLDSRGASVTIPESGKYSVLYFYDTSCASCKMESALLKNYLATNTFPLEFYAVYTGSDEASWKRYRENELNVPGAIHLWDPQVDSDFQMLYGVLQTPQMLFIGKDGSILGRKLDTPALGALISLEKGGDEYTYGSQFQMTFMQELFDQYGEDLSPESVEEIASYIAERTLGEGEMEQYKQMEGDLLYFLYGQRNEALKAGTISFIDKYILGTSGIWTSPSDTVNVISLAQMMKGLLERTPVGSKVPDITVPGVLRRRPCLFRKGAKAGEFRLVKLGSAYVVFYSEGCSSCQETLQAVDALIARERKAKVLLVDMDAIMTSDAELGTLLLDTFDLSVMPLVLKLGKGGVIEHKYVNL